MGTAAWPYIYRTHASPSMAPNLDSYFKTVDSSADSFVDRLRQAVAIPSISADEERRQDVVKMGMFLKSQLEGLGAHMEARPLGKQPGKEHLELPPAAQRKVVGRKPRPLELHRGGEGGGERVAYEAGSDEGGRFYPCHAHFRAGYGQECPLAADGLKH